MTTLNDTETTALVAVAEAGTMDALEFFDTYGGIVLHSLIGLDHLEQVGDRLQLGPEAPGVE